MLPERRHIPQRQQHETAQMGARMREHEPVAIASHYPTRVIDQVEVDGTRLVPVDTDSPEAVFDPVQEEQ